MANEKPAGGSSEGGNVGHTTGLADTSSTNPPTTQREERDSTPASGRGVEADAPAGPSLQRAGTLPVRRHGREGEGVTRNKAARTDDFIETSKP